MLVMIGFMSSSQFGQQVARIAGTAADITESAAAATNAGLDAAANVTSSAASLFVAAASASQDLSFEAWRGVDLANIELTLNTGTVVGDSVTVLSDWVDSAEGQLLTNFTETERKTALASLSHLGAAMPHIQINQAHLDVSQAPA